MPLTASLVLTTIFDPIVLETYFDNFSRYGHLDQVRIFVIPDRKTPMAAYERCRTLAKRGLRVHCLTLDDQENFLNKVGFPADVIPYNSDNRRNIGYLMALESGADFVISIDDDNYCLPDHDFFVAHALVCERDVCAEEVTASSGWFNICSLLDFDTAATPYPRGFPYFARHVSNKVERETKRVNVHLNTGLWLGDPDIDGISWLVAPAHAVSYSGKSVVLGLTTWSPVNTQNTALRREALAAYYFVKMGYPLAGMGNIDRYGDIFSGYFVQICAHHLGGMVRFGTPLVEHRRNSHNFMKDATNEWACILTLEDLLPYLTQVKLSGSTYPEVYTALSYALEDAVEHLHGIVWTDATRGYFHQMAYYMRVWSRVARRLL